jgi:porin
MRIRNNPRCSAAPGSTFTVPNSLALHFIFAPLSQYGFGNLFSTNESFDPPSTPAAEVRAIPASHFYIKSMVFAAERAPYAHNPTGFVSQFHGDPMSVSDIGYSPGRRVSAVRTQDNVEARKDYAGLYRFGGSYNPGMFASTSSNKPVSGNYLIYGMASQALYRTRPDTDRGIDLTIGADSSGQQPKQSGS